MPQSLAYIPVHVVFSTKNRRPLIDPELRQELYPLMGGILRKRDCNLIQVGGIADHIHLLLTLSRTTTVSDLIRDLKSDSTKWIKERWPSRNDYAWQNGYGAFGVGPRDVDAVVGYIRNQESHHHKDTFQDEFRRLLREHNMSWDERYIWD